MRKNVLFDELCLRQQTFGLYLRSALQERPAALLEAIRQSFEGVQSGRIEGSHITDPKHDHGSERLKIRDRFFECETGKDPGF